MEEPDGDRISYIIMHHGHSISDCKAFVATTDENVLVAVFDLWGKFYKCYIIKNDSIKNVEVENVLGGKEIKFDGESQYGKISVKMQSSSCPRNSGVAFKIPMTPVVFWAVRAVIALMAYTPFAIIVLISA